MDEDKMRTFIIHLPDGDGAPQRQARIDIPLSGGKLATIFYVWPMTPLQVEAFSLQCDQILKVVRKYFVRREASNEPANPTEQKEGIVSVQASSAGDRVAASGHADSTQASAGGESSSIEDVRDSGTGDEVRSQTPQALEQ